MELSEGDISIGMEEGRRSLIGNIFGEKRTNFLGVKGATMIWEAKGLCKVVGLSNNVYQFIF